MAGDDYWRCPNKMNDISALPSPTYHQNITAQKNKWHLASGFGKKLK